MYTTKYSLKQLKSQRNSGFALSVRLRAQVGWKASAQRVIFTLLLKPINIDLSLRFLVQALYCIFFNR